MNELINNFRYDRLISALVIGAVIIYSIFSHFLVFAIVMLVILAGMAKEWHDMAGSKKNEFLKGFLVISLSIFCLIVIKLFKYGSEILLWYFSTIWLFDTFSMIGGKNIGGKKLAEEISSQKTWSGLFCGLYFSTLFGSMIYGMFGIAGINEYKIFNLGVALPTTLISITALLGDLLESKFKRKYGLKDSGNLIPGHGGFLDRFDSILISSPILLLLMVQ